MLMQSGSNGALAAANSVALGGVVSTAAVAIVAVLIQVVIARYGVVGAERLRRYNELVDIYSKVGEVLSANTTTLAMSMRELVGKPNLIKAALVKRQMEKDIREFATTRNPRHSLNMLKLHRAGASVVDAERALFEKFEINIESSLTNEQARKWLESHMEEVNAALANYYVVAGDDARTQSDSIRFWRLGRK